MVLLFQSFRPQVSRETNPQILPPNNLCKYQRIQIRMQIQIQLKMIKSPTKQSLQTPENTNTNANIDKIPMIKSSHQIISANNKKYNYKYIYKYQSWNHCSKQSLQICQSIILFFSKYSFKEIVTGLWQQTSNQRKLAKKKTMYVAKYLTTSVLYLL